MVANEIIVKHLNILVQFINDLDSYSHEITVDELSKDRNKQNMVLYALIGAIQSCIDIGNHIIADLGLRRPEDYRDIFTILYENNYLDKMLCSQLSELVGFRNLAIHIYWRVDFEEVYSVLQESVNIFKKFAKAIKKFL
jgi:uncharacterized protein YutE (UPF0331/DUF86 family)